MIINIKRLSRLFTAGLLITVAAALPASQALAIDTGVTAPTITIDYSAVDQIDPSVLLDTASKTACTPKQNPTDPNSFYVGVGNLSYTTQETLVPYSLQYIWHVLSDTGNYSDSAEGWVPDTGCAKSVLIKSQIIDSTTAPGCTPVVASKVYTVNDHLHGVDGSGTKVLAAINKNEMQLPVTYYGVNNPLDTSGVTDSVDGFLPPTETTDSSGVGAQSIACIRQTSTVTVKASGSYLNNLNKWVAFGCTQDEYQVTAGADASVPPFLNAKIDPMVKYVGTFKC